MKIATQNVDDIDLEALYAAWSGIELRSLVQREVRENKDITGAMAAIVSSFDEKERRALQALTEEVAVLASEREFWDADGGEIARNFCARFGILLSEMGRSPGALESGVALRGVLLSLAFLAKKQKHVRRIAKIKKRFFLYSFFSRPF